jgi:hypothetical protein
MDVLEQSVVPKSGDASACEDGIVVTARFIAVIDGATDKTGRRFGDMTGGRYVMSRLRDLLPEVPSDADAWSAVRRLSEALDTDLGAGLAPEDRPGAAITVYSRARHEIWQVGDVGYWFHGLSPVPDRKEVDRVTVAMRGAVLRAELLRGTPADELAAADPGRQAIMPLLTRQTLFANNSAAGDLAYGVIDGRPVPRELVRVRSVPDGAREIVLASDGYPQILPSLAESESCLKEMMAADPLCIGPLAGTKAVAPGHLGYDDRAYVRFTVRGDRR